MWKTSDDIDEGKKSGTVDIDAWWRAMELKMLEAVVYKDAKMEPVVAANIAPWIPPLCRGNVVNTEHMKSKNSQANCSTTPIGCPKILAELIRREIFNPLDLQSLSVHNLLIGWHSLQANHYKGIPHLTISYTWQ